MKRENAWRVFAGEFNDSTVEIKSEEEMAPSYVVTPLGAKINRLFIVGVLTDVENVSEAGELIRAHISDPTGVFTLYSGQYQQDVTEILSEIDAPAFVAVVGKVRTYVPEEGSMYVSVRPEKIMEVSADIRDRWIIETCKNTKDRIEAVFEAMKMDEKNAFKIHKLGYSKELSEGIVIALKNYGKIDLNKYVTLIQESLQYLTPGKETLLDLKNKEESKKEQEVFTEEVEHKEKEIKKPEEETDKNFVELENTVLKIIRDIEGDDGASWDEITEKCEKASLEKDSIEEALMSLMDKGLIYEPVLGTIKTT
ncbi:MAG TPA: hypothetical protein ENN45_04350 [Bacteroidetes bacterium]|nr:hypothetical protein [Bacteroidota bacterium]